MRANELRRSFVDFFVERGHYAEKSGSLIPHDPTLLFTVAGMVPFKPYFTGEEPAPYKRAVTVQKCVRAGGKHNDLDEIGRTKRHLTFFEMLGNFSFGDYFKSEACAWAWEFITKELQLDPGRLWVTVHITDDEAEAIWRDEVGVPADHIQRLDEDNYWQMADTGPQGPSSEIFWDKGPEFGADGGPAHGGEERFIEIWNLVFMQFDGQPDGTKVALPKPSIDTGAGLERIVSVLQGVDSVWDIDEFVSLDATARQLTGLTGAVDDEQTVSLRILADHARSTTFLVADGVFPSNEGRGYVLRRILRRAVRHAYLLGVETPVMGALVDAVVELMGGDYPELVSNQQFVHDVIDREEMRFRETLRTGQAILDKEFKELTDSAPLSGTTAFLLHDTYGFPIEVTQEIAAERNIEVDVDGFRAAMLEQQQRAKAARRVDMGADTGPYTALLETHGPTEFTGRDEATTTAQVLAVFDDAIVLDRTAFYAESGGQVGDTGTITTPTGTAIIADTVYGAPGLHIHRVDKIEGAITEGQAATAAIDNERRKAIRRNHTATHLLHWALRKELGEHVKQQGSYVGPDRLRFDFSHYEGLTPEQLASIEDLVNREILDNAEARHFETDMDEAEALGAIAFFGDKYGDRVRVLQAGHNSVELCGGTHVSALGDIGSLHIESEGSIGSNIRRVEAFTGLTTIEALRSSESIISNAADRLGVATDELLDGISRRMAEAKELRAELSQLRSKLAAGQAPALAATAIDGVVVARVDGVDRDGLRDLAVTLRDMADVKAAILGAAFDGGGVGLAAASSTETLDAGALIAEAKQLIGGGGRPAPDLAVAGGKNVEALDEALDSVRRAAGIV